MDSIGLFGIENSNRDFTQKSSWGKNQFNNAFPVALMNYMSTKSLNPVYIQLSESNIVNHSQIGTKELYGIEYDSPKVFYNFEAEFSPYSQYIKGILPRVDLVIARTSRDNVENLRGLEIKLTALPDNHTANESRENHGSELVVRPDTIVYLALSLIKNLEMSRKEMAHELNVDKFVNINWKSIIEMAPQVSEIANILQRFLVSNIAFQQPLLIQPIWRTVGKTLVLDDKCLDVFVWSDMALSKLFTDPSANSNSLDRISRLERTTIWVYKMLLDYVVEGKVPHREIIDKLTYDTKNDKAFALSGSRTQGYMNCQELLEPRIHKDEIKNIVVNGGQNMLSPERRFDAALLSTPNLFDN